MKKRLLSTLGAAIISTCFSLPATADSFTYTLNIDHCTGGCGTNPFGTITVSDLASNQVSLAISVSPNFLLQTGQAGSTVAFNLSGNPNISIVSSVLPGWSLDSSSAGSLHFDGFGSFEYSLNCCFGNNGGSNKQTGNNTVVLQGTGLNAADFQELSSGGSPSTYFAVDIYDDQSPNNTGPVGTNTTPTAGTVPEPGSIVLLGSIATAVVGITRRKRTA